MNLRKINWNSPNSFVAVINLTRMRSEMVNKCYCDLISRIFIEIMKPPFTFEEVSAREIRYITRNLKYTDIHPDVIIDRLRSLI